MTLTKQILIRTLYSSIIILWICLACSSGRTREIENTVNQFYKTLNKREAFSSFLDFYAEDIILEDIINGDRIQGKESLSTFLEWENTSFKKIEANTLHVTEKIIQENKVVVKGYFTSFQWGETIYGPMHFTTILTFNESGKIIHQVDWINYPPNLVDYDTRKNSNDWLKK